MKQLEVQIMGQSYLLGCPEGGDARLLEAVERVDSAMCKIRDAGKVRARDRIAVLAALNLAFDLTDVPPAQNSGKGTAAVKTPIARSNEDAGDSDLLLTSLLERLEGKRGQVRATFQGKPLNEAIEEIAEATGATLAVSPLLPAAVRQAPVTVRFANTPVDAAVRTLCELTECAVIEDANVLLVTTRERAAARAKEEAQKLKDRQPVGPGPLGCMPFGGGLGVAAQPDFAAEIAKLKEQNELMRKELDELRKAKK